MKILKKVRTIQQQQQQVYRNKWNFSQEIVDKQLVVVKVGPAAER